MVKISRKSRLNHRRLETSLADELDIAPHDISGSMSFGPETDYYKEAEKLNENDWSHYLDIMATRGYSVEYDHVEDVYEIIADLTGI